MRLFKFFTVILTLLVLTACVAPAAAPAGDAATAVPSEENTTAESASGAIKVGFMGPLTGGAAFLGNEQKGFTKVTIDLFNERTGLNVALVAEDSELNPDIAKTVAERMVADPEIVVVIGPAGSQECESTKPVFAEGGLAHLTQSCTRTDLTDPDKVTPTFFRPIPRDVDQSQTDGAYMLNTLGVKAAYLVDDQSSYAVGLCDELQAALEASGVTVERTSVSPEETDFSSVVTGILTAGSDLVFFPGQLANQLSTLAIQLREQGYTGVYFMADGGFSADLLSAGGSAVEDAYVSVFSADPNLVPDAKPYTERYVAEFGEQFGAFGGASALTTFVALDAIERCATEGAVTRACVLEKLKTTDLQETPLGIPIKFDENNQVANSKFFIFQIKDNKFTLVQ